MTKKEKALQDSKENFVNALYRICDWIQDECDRLKDKEFEDEYSFLFYKAFVLFRLLAQLPLGSKHCPFCMVNATYDDSNYMLFPDCSKCTYAATHGVCRDRNSIYKLLSNSIGLVRKILGHFYAAEKPEREDVVSVLNLVNKINDQLTYWRYHDLLTKKEKGGKR